MAKLLLIDTTTALCSVAISENEQCIIEKNSVRDFSHSEMLTLMIQEVLDGAGISQSNLDGIAVSNGPGSYTGLRVGMSVAKGLCYALDKPLIAVSTLHALAFPYAFANQKLIIPMIDARREEVYCCYVDSNYQLINQDFNQILDRNFLESLQKEHENLLFCGNGAFKVQNYLESTDLGIEIHESQCLASNMAYLANKSFQTQDFADLAYHEPFYLKSANITVPKKLV